MTTRDYLTDMNNAIEAAIPNGDYAAPIIAAELVDHLRTDDPDLLEGWLNLRASVFLADAIARRSNSKRQTARTMAPRRSFAEAARSFTEKTDTAELRPFAFEYVVDEANTRRAVARMTAADCRFVAAQYEQTARTAQMEAAFHRAVAAKVGVGVVRDVFTESQYLAMYRSLTGSSGLSAAA